MAVATSFTSSQVHSPYLAILVGGFAAGVFDAIMAFISFGWRMPRGIASGVLGARAATVGAGVWILGLVLHFTIAIGAAAIYYLVSRRLDFLREHFVICGIFFGVAVYLVMNLIILPLSAVPFPIGPFPLRSMIQGLLVHMILIGLPIAASVRLFSRPA